MNDEENVVVSNVTNANGAKRMEIKGKTLYVDNISVNDKVSFYLTKYYKVENVKKTNQMLRESLKTGEYLGMCIINQYGTSGHLIKVSDNLYVVLGLDLLKIIYSSNTLTAFHIIDTPSNFLVVVNGKEHDIANIELSAHFIKQSSERFKIPAENIKSLFFDIVINGRYICITHCKEYYNPAHLFCKDGKLVYISLDFKAAITTYSNSLNTLGTHPNIKEKIEILLTGEVKKLSKQEIKMKSRNLKDKLIKNLRIAEIELEIFNSKNKPLIEKLQLELKNLKEHLEFIEDEWNDLVDEIRRHAITLSSFV